MKTSSIHTKSGLLRLAIIFVFAFFLQLTAFSQTITVDGNPSDWPAVLMNQPIATFEKDLPQSNDNQFTEGTKDFHNTNNMVWSLSPVGDKVNLVNAGAAIIDGWFTSLATVHPVTGRPKSGSGFSRMVLRLPRDSDFHLKKR